MRWEALDDYLGRGTAIELHLPQLSIREAIMLMDNLPRLRQEPMKTKIAIYKKVGGHPKSIELLNGWLANGRVTDLLADPNLDNMLVREWEAYFLGALLGHITPTEREALTRLSIFRTCLDDEEFDYAGVKPATLYRWLDLSLLQREDKRYTIHPVVREYLLGQRTPDEQKELHTWAATFQGRPFVEIAKQSVKPGATVTEKETEQFARNRVVKANVARTDNIAAARGAMACALEWQHHLFAVGDYEAAGEIVTAVFEILVRWGERDRAKALLRGSIETLKGRSQAVDQANLLMLLMEEGKQAEAINSYQEVYHNFEVLGATQQMVAVLHNQSVLNLMMARYDEAIAAAEQTLALAREHGDKEQEAASLHQLSMVNRTKGDYPSALTHSQEAEELARQIKHEAGIARTLYEQGTIYSKMAYTANEEAKFRVHSQTAVERFQESLTIMRRIGDEAGVADSLGALGTFLLEARQTGDAIAAFNESLEINQRLGRPVKVGIDVELLGRVHERQGHYQAALEKYQQARKIFEQYGPPPEGFGIIDRDIAQVQEKMKGGG